ncbi:condensation domain-containing protein, partial [Chitinophagaceae bacterium LB-8]
MMEIKEFIGTLEKKNFSLAVENEKLILKGDRKKLTADEIEDIKKNEFIINYIKERKSEIIQYLSQLPASYPAERKTKSVASIYPLSGLQMGMLFHGLYDEETRAYIQQFGCDLFGVVEYVFCKSWNHVLQCHSVLRSSFYYDEFSEPVQCVYNDVELPIVILDYRNMNETEQKEALKKYEEADYNKGFDFKAVPLMRMALIRLNENQYRMLWTFHHILFDGWSLPVLLEEFLNAYELLISGKPLQLEKEDRYEDFISYLEIRDKEGDETYWLNYLKDVEQSTLLPFIRSTAERTKVAGKFRSEELQLSTATISKILAYTRYNRITLNTLMQGVWSYLLHRYTGCGVIVFGTIVSTRPDDLPNIEQRVGMYINNLPLRSHMEEESGIVEWLQNLQQEQASSRQYQYTILNDIQSWTSVQGELFDSLLTFENYPVSDDFFSDQRRLSFRNLYHNGQSNYPLTIIINSIGQIKIEFKYNSNLLEETHVKEIRQHFENVLLQIVDKANGKLKDINYLTSFEQQQLLHGFNSCEVAYPKHHTLVSL